MRNARPKGRAFSRLGDPCAPLLISSRFTGGETMTSPGCEVEVVARRPLLPPLAGGEHEGGATLDTEARPAKMGGVGHESRSTCAGATSRMNGPLKASISPRTRTRAAGSASIAGSSKASEYSGGAPAVKSVR